jgi:hypothetical protein
MRTKLFALLLLAGGSLFAETHLSIGIGLGTPYYYDYAPPPPVIAYAPPLCPGPDYTWIAGYWYPAGRRYAWHAGFWSRPPYAGAYWVAPRYYEHRYYQGYWGGENGTGIVRTTTSAGSTMTAGCTEVGTSTTTTTKRDVDISAPRAKDKAARRIQRKQNRAGSTGDTSSDDTPKAGPDSSPRSNQPPTCSS